MEKVSEVLMIALLEMLLFLGLIIIHDLMQTIKKISFNFKRRNNFGVNRRFGSPEENFSLNFSRAKTRFSLSQHDNADNSHFFVIGKEIYKFKASYKKN